MFKLFYSITTTLMISNIKFVIIDFIDFLQSPTNTENKRVNFLYYFFVYFFVYFSSMCLYLGIVILYNVIDVPYDPVVSNSQPLILSSIIFFIFGVILAPIIEELSFRYPLKYTQNALSIGLIFFTISAFFTNQTVISGHHNMSFFIQRLMNPNFLRFLLAILLIYFVTRFEKVNVFLSNIWDKYLTVIIYLLAAYFAYEHFPMPKTAKNLIWIPPLILPYFISALYFSYIRLKFNLLYCILLHTIGNLIFFALTYKHF